MRRRHTRASIVVLAASALLAADTPARSVSASTVVNAQSALWLIDLPEAAGDSAFTSQVHEVAGGFSAAIASWNTVTPGGSWIEVDLRARIGKRFTRWYDMGRWSADSSSNQRRSTKGQRDADASVDTDTLNLNRPAEAIQVRVLPHAGAGGVMPQVSLVAVATNTLAPRSADAFGLPSAPAADLPVPERSQRSAPSSPDQFGGGGDAWCSPASVSMVMAYWSQALHEPRWDVPVESAAAGTYDPVYDGCGNWPFNVAFASERGLRGWVQRLTRLNDVRQLIGAGIPVIASIKAAPGELSGAPYKRTNGHLLVVRGFTDSGDVIVNDPYALPGGIRRVYNRAQFAHAWLEGSLGTVYLIAPPDKLQRG